MSAGGLSYDGLTTSRKVTLPSVEMWNTNMNILRNPTSGIFTRRKDKVSQTQGTLLQQEDSGDRIAECINVYARGVNPMVSVSYDNYSNNAGSFPGRTSQGVKLPYKPEVFRPPVVRPQQLMPLSRQPRNYFYALTNPSLPNIINQMSCNEAKSSVNSDLLRPIAPPSYRKNIEKIQPVSTTSNIHKDILQYNASTTLKGLRQGVDDFRYMLKKLQTASLIEDPLKTSVQTMKSSNASSCNISPKIIDRIKEDPLYVKNVIASMSGRERDQEMEKTTSYGMNENKLMYDIITQKISNLNKYSEDRGFVPASSSTKEINPTEVFTRPVTSLRIDMPNNYEEQDISQASKAFLYKQVRSQPATSLHQQNNIETDVAHNIRNITTLQVNTPTTKTQAQSWMHPDKMDRPMENKRPLGNIETVNHQYSTTKSLPHETMSSGNIELRRTPIEAQTIKTSYERSGDHGETTLERNQLLIQDVSTARDTKAMGSDTYSVQSRDGYQYRNQRPSAGGFQGVGNAIPRVGELSQPSEIPVNSDWTNVKKAAYRQLQTRYG